MCTIVTLISANLWPVNLGTAGVKLTLKAGTWHLITATCPVIMWVLVSLTLTINRLQKIGRMIVVGGSTKTDARGVLMNAIMTIDAHTVLDGTMDLQTVGREINKTENHKDKVEIKMDIVQVQVQKKTKINYVNIMLF